MSARKRVLVVAAHPDDEVLGCGGTIARLSKEGHEVTVAILAEGVTSRYGNRSAAPAKVLKELHAQARQAGKILGATEVRLHRMPDNRLDTVPMLDVTKTIEKLVGEIRPQVVYTHHPGDLNVDHEVVARAVLTATRPVAGHSVRELYFFEVASSTEWAFQQLGDAFHANAFVDIRATLETKIQAMACYKGESRAFPHPRSPEALRAIAQRWGSVVGCEAAEAFQLVRALV